MASASRRDAAGAGAAGLVLARGWRVAPNGFGLHARRGRKQRVGRFLARRRRAARRAGRARRSAGVRWRRRRAARRLLRHGRLGPRGLAGRTRHTRRVGRAAPDGERHPWRGGRRNQRRVVEAGDGLVEQRQVEPVLARPRGARRASARHGPRLAQRQVGHRAVRRVGPKPRFARAAGVGCPAPARSRSRSYGSDRDCRS